MPPMPQVAFTAGRLAVTRHHRSIPAAEVPHAFSRSAPAQGRGHRGAGGGSDPAALCPRHDGLGQGGCLVAEGKADVYPRFGPTMEWDTAAGDAVLRIAGGRVETTQGEPFLYVKPGFRNPGFIARGK